MSQTVLIVGATGGIGSALTELLAADGVRLVLAARDADPLQELADRVDALAVPTDARESDQVEALFARIAEQELTLDGVVNLAGSILIKPAHRTSDAEWSDTLATNLTTSFHLVRGGAKAMMKGGGSIVLLASAAGQIGLANHEAIAAAKAGVIGLARSAANTYSSRGIRVNAVSPGLVETPLSAGMLKHEAGRKASLALHASDRLGQPGDVARMIRFLLDPANDWVTGQVFGVDGGLGTLKPPPRIRA